MATRFDETRKTADNSGYQFPASQKVYLTGSRPDISVPMREIALSPTQSVPGGPVIAENDPFRVYDTSGHYTDPGYVHDVRAGLAPIRLAYSGSQATSRSWSRPIHLKQASSYHIGEQC